MEEITLNLDFGYKPEPTFKLTSSTNVLSQSLPAEPDKKYNIHYVATLYCFNKSCLGNVLHNIYTARCILS